MPHHAPPPPERRDNHGPRSLLWGAGMGLLVVACCAGPALLATGAAAAALGAIGALASSPWVIGAAIALAALVVTRLLRRAERRPGQCDGDRRLPRPHGTTSSRRRRTSDPDAK